MARGRSRSALMASGKGGCGCQMAHGAPFYGKTRAEAVKKLREAHRNAQKGLPIPSERYKVEEFLEEWLANGQHRLKPKTWQRYKEIVTLHLIPALGSTPLARLTASQVHRISRHLARLTI